MNPANEVRITRDGRIFADNFEVLSVSSVRIDIVPDTLFEITLGTYEWSMVVEDRFGKEKVWHRNRFRAELAPEARYMPGGGISFGSIRVPGGYYFRPSERRGELLMCICACKLIVDNAVPPYSGEYPEWDTPRIRDQKTRWDKFKEFFGEYLVPILVSVATTVLVRKALGL